MSKPWLSSFAAHFLICHSGLVEDVCPKYSCETSCSDAQASRCCRNRRLVQRLHDLDAYSQGAFVEPSEVHQLCLDFLRLPSEELSSCAWASLQMAWTAKAAVSSRDVKSNETCSLKAMALRYPKRPGKAEDYKDLLKGLPPLAIFYFRR